MSRIVTPATIVFEDHDIIVLNKPAGIPVHKTLDARRENLADELSAFLRQRDQIEKPYVGIHHRLDLDTTGLILFTKTMAVNGSVAALFEERALLKTYIAILAGTLSPLNGEMNDFMKKTHGRRGEKMAIVRSGGQKALARYETLQTLRHSSVVAIELLTGRTHQIRVQTSSRGCPVVGDRLYGQEAFNQKFRAGRQLLHAHSMEFKHPVTGEHLHLQAPLPGDMTEWILREGGQWED